MRFFGELISKSQKRLFLILKVIVFLIYIENCIFAILCEEKKKHLQECPQQTTIKKEQEKVRPNKNHSLLPWIMFLPIVSIQQYDYNAA